jgi:adenosylcobyric acid synthase
MAEWIKVQGTKSSAGKSLITSLLLEILSEEHEVVPFKPVNFSRNSFPVENSEIGYSTLQQARKAGVEPEKIMAPVLVKPMEDKTELIAHQGVEKTSYENLDVKIGEKYSFIEECIEELDERFDYVVWEGFGSLVNSNLENNPNEDFLQKTDAEILLVGDVSEGGVEAQLKGMHELLPEQLKDKVSANIINKASRVAENLEKTENFMEKKTGVKTFSLPYLDDLNFPEEDGTPGFSGSGEIAVIDYPHASNTSDLELLPGDKTHLANKPSELDNSSLIILLGSKNTLKDLRWMKEMNLDEKILENSPEAVIFGICGGFQMLGEEISGNEMEQGEVSGLGLVEMKTGFSDSKTLDQVEYRFHGENFSGYRIHYGDSKLSGRNLFETSSGREGFLRTESVGPTYTKRS